jgi:hypothetical protein
MPSKRTRESRAPPAPAVRRKRAAFTPTQGRAVPPHPVTPDGRYFVVRGRLWRCTNPQLGEEERQRLTRELMAARRAVGSALRANDQSALRAARAKVDGAKVALGERGAVWWSDGAPDYNQRMAANTPYAKWFAELADGQHHDTLRERG